VLTGAGFREVILPVLDYAAPYQGVTAEGDEHLYQFMDREGELLSLRADFTPMAARVLAPRLSALAMPVSLFYRGDVVRDEKAGVGRPREFAQIGAECFGDPSFDADQRMLELLVRSLADVPVERLRVTLGYANLLRALLSAVAPDLTRGDGALLVEVLAAARERRVSRVEKALRQAGAAVAEAEEISFGLLVGFDPGSALFRRPVLTAGATELVRAVACARAVRPGVPVTVDLAGTPSAPYYSGLTFGVDATGVAAPLASGGRYDHLLARFGTPAPATGFSIGLEALVLALRCPESGTAPEVPRPIRIAVGKGRLLAATLAALREGGAEFAEPDGRRLLVSDLSGKFELLLLKDDDVPTYVAHGGADLGVVGSDRVAESGEEVFSPVEFPFGACRLALIGRVGETFRPDGQPVRIGTKYQRLAARVFDERRIAHEIVPLAGSVELAAALKLTDVIVDLIETGSTIAAHGLVEIETLLESRATLIVGRGALVARRGEIASFVARLRSRVGVTC
jgi:ATP phosphoribosyltransferase